MGNVVHLKSERGFDANFVQKSPVQGAIKDVYFSPDKSLVVAFYRNAISVQIRERLRSIVGEYRDGIFEQIGGAYWKTVFCWPIDLVEYDGRVGVLIPYYDDDFFFTYGSFDGDSLGIRGTDKQGKWFTSGTHLTKYLDPRERGDWRRFIQASLRLSRAIRRLHAAGLAHSDLSYKNCLLDPTTGRACVIDLDGLVVPGKYPPDVAGTPDFFAPEVVSTMKLAFGDSQRVHPSIDTDCHALATLIYMYLLYRHPLVGSKHHHSDVDKDVEIAMGTGALFVENPNDLSNIVQKASLRDSDFPWGDPSAIPYEVSGPYLSPLFERAFVDGLHEPEKRPRAGEWESALARTYDLLYPCTNDKCVQQWFVLSLTKKAECPFCRTMQAGRIPLLHFYISRDGKEFRSESRYMVMYHNAILYQWHTDRFISPSEKLTKDQLEREGYVGKTADGKWYLVNERMNDLWNHTEKSAVSIGERVELIENLQLIFDKQSASSRLITVRFTNHN